MTETKPVSSRRDLKDFIYLPAGLYKSNVYWVPPIYKDEWRYFNPKLNYAYSYCDTILGLCFKNGVLAGRIMGIINYRYNHNKGEQHGRFARFESINDPEVAGSLLEFVENWSRSKGMNRIIGPYGMNYFDPEGLLTEGFEYPPTISTNYNFAYYSDLLQNLGFETMTDYVVYKIDLPNKIPEIYYSIRSRLMRNNSFGLIEFMKKKDLRKRTRSILELMNECFIDITGFSPLDKEEMDEIAKQYLNLLDPRFIKLVKHDEELAGFIVAMPHISQGLRKSGGKLFPFGLLYIIKDMKDSRQIDLLLGGVKRKYQGIGLDVVLGMNMIETAVASGFNLLDSHHEMASNYKVRAEMERMGGVPYKRYCVFQKSL